MTATVRKATAADHAWIESLLRAGARDGHFSPMIGQQAPNMLRDIARFGSIDVVNVRNGMLERRRKRIDLWVADWAGTPAAFLLCMHDAAGYELNLSGTRPDFRRKGCFDALVNQAIDAAPAMARIYARCYKPSVVALAALQRRGFVITQTGDPDELTLQPPTPATASVDVSTAGIAPGPAAPIAPTLRPNWQRMLAWFRRTR